jgi:hypothetical protein
LSIWPIENATGMIVNFTGDENFAFREVSWRNGLFTAISNHQAEIIPGQIVDNRLQDEVEIILIVTVMASTPLESLNTKPKLKSILREREKTSPTTFSSNVAIPDSIQSRGGDKSTGTVLSSTKQPCDQCNRCMDRIIPTPQISEKKNSLHPLEGSHLKHLCPAGIKRLAHPPSITTKRWKFWHDKDCDLISRRLFEGKM